MSYCGLLHPAINGDGFYLQWSRSSSNPPHLYILIMYFAKLDHSLQHIVLQHNLPVETMFERWLKKRGETNDPDAWRELDGIPCIVGGLAVLLGKLEAPPLQRARGYTTLRFVSAESLPTPSRTTYSLSNPSLAKTPVQSSWPPVGLSSSGNRLDRKGLRRLEFTDTSSDTSSYTSPEPSPAPVSDAPRPRPGPASLSHASCTLHPRPRPARVSCTPRPCPCPASLRRPGLAPVALSPAPCPQRLKLCVEVPLAPLSWRSAFNPALLPLCKPNIDELIPDISCLGQASQYSDGATHEEDEVEVDELFGTQGSKVVCAV
ncbi:hypothetical protein CY34DRAFT_17626 [Suillus luteus UH-Slu-Lm8-n1]|uniref:Uncharacterized protein n=1 Tax=Suillus luteus UH-Slu-Lm8-n1 TaxID=930992 RepID=A0A0C9ZYN3_9AGAM|nr:hypothetical protein CY34DRAFT_17626 [Suillus luteus UH-Slu-Lm8-n1]